MQLYNLYRLDADPKNVHPENNFCVLLSLLYVYNITGAHNVLVNNIYRTFRYIKATVSYTYVLYTLYIL